MRRIRLSVALAAAVVALGGVTAHATEAATPTSVELTRVLSPITYGQSTVIEGKVQTDGGALPGVNVQLYSRSSTSKPWTYVSSATTGAEDGLFRFRRQPPQNYYYSVNFRGTDEYDSSSAQAKVEVRRKLTPSEMNGTQSAKFAFTGPAKPTSKSRYKTVKLRVKKCDSCSWQTIASTTTNGYSIWRFLVAGPTSNGKTYTYRAYIPATSDFAIGYSEQWRITT